jgi:hypothetical protein
MGGVVDTFDNIFNPGKTPAASAARRANKRAQQLTDEQIKEQQYQRQLKTRELFTQRIGIIKGAAGAWDAPSLQQYNIPPPQQGDGRVRNPNFDPAQSFQPGRGEFL